MFSREELIKRITLEKDNLDNSIKQDVPINDVVLAAYDTAITTLDWVMKKIDELSDDGEVTSCETTEETDV